MPRGTKAPKLWPAEPSKLSEMVPSGSPAPPWRLVTSEPSMVPTARWMLRMGRSRRDRPALADRRAAGLDQLAVEGRVEAVVLGAGAVKRGRGMCDRLEDGTEIELARLPVVVDGRRGVQALDVPDGLGHRPEAERGEKLAALLGDVVEEGLDELRLPGEMLAELRVLGRDADGAGVEVADAHHHAPGDDERGGREAELLGSEQRGHDHVPPCLQLAVDLHRDAVPETVAEQGLLRLGQAELPRARPRV